MRIPAHRRINAPAAARHPPTPAEPDGRKSNNAQTRTTNQPDANDHPTPCGVEGLHLSRNSKGRTHSHRRMVSKQTLPASLAQALRFLDVIILPSVSVPEPAHVSSRTAP